MSTPPNLEREGARRSPVRFVALLLVLSAPFLRIGAASRVRLLPGLPLSALMAICPAIAASILVRTEEGRAGVIALLKRSFDYARIAAIWYVPAVLLMPLVMLVSYVLMRWTRAPLPSPHVSVLAVPLLFAAFFASALGEELGWSGYLTDPLRDRWGAVAAGVLIGVVWAAWHIVPYAQGDRSPAWIAWQCLFTVSLRVVLVWLYDQTGKSVFAATVLHAMSNVSAFSFPNQGSHYDPQMTGLVMTLVAVIVTIF